MNATERSRRSPLRVSLAALVALLVLPSANAVPVLSGSLEASLVDMQSAKLAGSLSFFHVLRAEGGSLAAPAITLSAQSLTWTEVHDRGPAAAVPSPQGGSLVVATGEMLRSLGQGQPITPRTERDASFEATSAQPRFTLNIYALTPVDAQASADEVHLTGLRIPHIGPTGISEKHEREDLPANDPNRPPPSVFTQFAIQQPMVRSMAEGPSSLEISGNFVIEMIGISGTIRGQASTHQVQSGIWKDPVVGGAPKDFVYNEDRAFVRIQVTGGTASLAFLTDMAAQWAGPTVVATSPQATLSEARGTVMSQDGLETQVQADSYRLEGPHRLTLLSGGDHVDAGVQGLDAQGNPLQLNQAVATQIPAAMVGTFVGLFALSVLLGLGTWTWRRRHTPKLADVERALRDGDYRQAARDAARILRASPGMETAILSRAIALSKRGLHRRVVRELEGHLGASRPSDGSLHYVLGVAYSDLGEAAKAQQAFDEAVRRTPDLGQAVHARAPAGSRRENPFTGLPAETSGYA